MPRIAAVQRTTFEAAEPGAARTDILDLSSSAVSVEDFDYEDRFTPVALRIIPPGRGNEADSEVLSST
ncbi:MAG: hypothetical protein LDL33_11255 [Desulfomonile sp.]|nr:hypothetical protein [Desulfomonile sp.]